MKTYGIFRKTDDVGRMVLPKEMRDFYQIQKNDLVEILSVDGGILIRKATHFPRKNDNETP